MLSGLHEVAGSIPASPLFHIWIRVIVPGLLEKSCSESSVLSCGFGNVFMAIKPLIGATCNHVHTTNHDS